MESWAQIAVSIITALVASSGIWAYFERRTKVKDANGRLLMGLAYDKITFLGMGYLQRGWITKDEYEDFRKYLYEPYRDYGGNGVAERIMNEVSNLPLKSHSKYTDIVKAKRAGKEHEDDS